LNQGSNLPNFRSHDPTDRFGLARVEPVLEPSVALARRATRAFGATVHTTPAPFVLYLYPAIGAPGAIGRAKALRDNALASERAGVPVNDRALHVAK
jgi:hypothetical protein